MRRFGPIARSRGVEKASKFEELVSRRSRNDQRIVLTVPPRSIGRTSGQVGGYQREGVLREIELEVGRSSKVGLVTLVLVRCSGLSYGSLRHPQIIIAAAPAK